jgi:hypothetical protein
MKLLIALLTLAIGCYAADVAGKWNVSAPTGNGGEMKLRLVIQADGQSYSGVISNEEGEAVLRDVTVKESAVTFRVETGDAQYEVTATVDGDTIKGSYKVNNSPGVSFIGTRTR